MNNKEIEENINFLKKRIEDLEKPYIGECYGNQRNHYGPWVGWIKFKNFEKCPEGSVKVNGLWFPKEQVVFYDAPVVELKEKAKKFFDKKAESRQGEV